MTKSSQLNVWDMDWFKQGWATYGPIWPAKQIFLPATSFLAKNQLMQKKQV